MDTLEIISLLAVVGMALHWLNHQDRRKRTALLASHLQPFQIERLMQQLTEAYMRALGESDPERQNQVLQLQQEAEQQLARQFQELARAFAQLPAPEARTLKLALPGVDKVLPQSTFDTRRVLQVHADGLGRAVRNEAGRSPRDKAFTLMAEMFLMQHSCHWFCKSKAVASTRLVLRHQTPYEKVLESVAPATRRAYEALVSR